MLRKRNWRFLTCGLLFCNITAFAQGDGAWLFLSHTQKLSQKFDLLADVQLRSTEHITYFSTLLLRTAFNYNLNKHQSVALGYAHKGDWEKEDGRKSYSPEHRIYEQYLHQIKLERMELMLRGRLEQRFVKEEQYEFSQRARLLLSAQIPLIANKDFTRGIYASLQDEVFLNVQHKGNVNGSFFDQNRPYASAGYRFSKKLDIEFGYTRWLQREDTGDKTSDVMQLMITTNL
ncbi:DUF2490 domain-containing protein [Pedobacter hartonius]|uniref:DUF2490 domain-containing protein n=1 Tax=Pedobacter hartonius TaxID=425514 RepID=A0A1H3XEH8_9SPHI|nr:DUF2490 domain-containing protein [Pedobacter hartonius]SDZ97084.1 Protein of unknown function [Pedobacter hartonius]